MMHNFLIHRDCICVAFKPIACFDVALLSLLIVHQMEEKNIKQYILSK